MKEIDINKAKILLEQHDKKVEYEKMEEFVIKEYVDTLLEGIEELENTNPEDVISWGYKSLDDKIGYILPGQLILVGGTTGTGKSTFTSEIAKNISKQGKTVLKFTLEDRLQDRKKQDLYYDINSERKQKGLNWYPYNDFFSNNINSGTIKEEIQKSKIRLMKDNKGIYDVVRNKDTQMGISDVETIIKKGIEKGVKLIVLDHLQEFKVESSNDRQDLRIEETMYNIKNLSRKYNIAIILIAHFKKIEGRPNLNSFKDTIAISQVSNKVLLLYRDLIEPTGITELIVAKNREKPNGTGILELNFNIETLKYTNIKSELQNKYELIKD